MIVLNWNGAGDTLECLRSLGESETPVHVIVVDNGSTDGSAREISESGLADEVLETGANLGYAEGNNVGLRFALDQGFPVIAVLNNDTVVEPGSVGALIDQLGDGEHRALSPDIRYYNDPSRSWFAGGVIDRGWPRHLQAEEIPGGGRPLRESECLSGCCILARRETWQNVGLFDPGYFLIFEDSDWSLRATRSNVKLYVVPGSIIKHKVSRSFESGPQSLLGGYYFVRNGLSFHARYARRFFVRFLLQWLFRQTIRAALGREQVGDVALRWLGALSFVVGITGRAPRVAERLAGVLARRRRRRASPGLTPNE